MCVVCDGPSSPEVSDALTDLQRRYQLTDEQRADAHEALRALTEPFSLGDAVDVVRALLDVVPPSRNQPI